MHFSKNLTFLDYMILLSPLLNSWYIIILLAKLVLANYIEYSQYLQALLLTQVLKPLIKLINSFIILIAPNLIGQLICLE